jgi:hypothetical protein
MGDKMANDDSDPLLSVYQWRLCEIIEGLMKTNKSPRAECLLRAAVLEMEISRDAADRPSYALRFPLKAGHALNSSNIYSRLEHEFGII